MFLQKFAKPVSAACLHRTHKTVYILIQNLLPHQLKHTHGFQLFSTWEESVSFLPAIRILYFELIKFKLDSGQGPQGLVWTWALVALAHLTFGAMPKEDRCSHSGLKSKSIEILSTDGLTNAEQTWPRGYAVGTQG